jgi:hypothetical protein
MSVKGGCLTCPKPATIDVEDLLPTERVGMVVAWLYEHRGCEYTTATLAQFVGLQHHSTWLMLCKLSRVLPIRQSLTGWSVPD